MTTLRIVIASAVAALGLLAAVLLIEPEVQGAGAAALPEATPSALRVAELSPRASDGRGEVTSSSTRAPVEPLAVTHATGHYGPEVPSLGRTATLAGHVTVDGVGARAQLRFEAGPNAGATLSTDDEGRYSWPLLYPGFGMLTVDAGFRCTREIVLRHRKTDTYDVALAELGLLEGRVLDAEDVPVVDALVSLDGAQTRTGRGGVFAVARQAAGTALLVVRQPGFVPYCERLRDGHGQTGGRPVQVQLQRGATLDLTVGDLTAGGVSGGGEVLVWLVPTAGQRLAGAMPGAAYPWHELNPLRMQAGERRRLHDLPPIKLEALAFHAQAKGSALGFLRSAEQLARDARPTPRGQATVMRGSVAAAASFTGHEAGTPGERPAAAQTLTLHVPLQPVDEAVVRVLRHGEPVPGAQVRVAHGNRLAATLASFGPLGDQAIRSQPLLVLPGAEQWAMSRADGRVAVGIDRDVKGTLYVTVTAPGGSVEITRPWTPRPGEDELVVDLGRPDSP